MEESWLKVLRRFVGKAAVVWIAVRLVRSYLKWKRLRMMMWKAGATGPIWNEQSSLLGPIPVAIKEFPRLYDFKLDMYKKYGGSTYAVGLTVWDPQVGVSTRDPADVKYILKDNINNYVKGERFREYFGDFLGKGIFGVDHGPAAPDHGVAWLHQRKTASKIFTRNIFRGMVHKALVHHCGVLTTRIESHVKSGETVDLQPLMYKFTLDTIGSIGFGVELNTLQKDFVPFAYSFDQAQKLTTDRFTRPGWNIKYLGPLLYPKEKELVEHIRNLHEFCDKVINERKRDKELEKKGDILSLFMKEDDCDDETLRWVVISFFVAGRDTTGCLTSFALLTLLHHQDLQDKLRAELHSKLGKNTQTPPSLEDLEQHNLPYLHAIVFETLRLYPSVPINFKVSVEDDVLPSGAFVPRNSRVMYEPYCMGRDPERWGPDAEEFKPERWLADDFIAPNEYEMPVFQGGNRICLGKDLAVYEAKFVLCQLIRNFKFSKPDPSTKFPQPPYVPGITMTVNGGVESKVSHP